MLPIVRGLEKEYADRIEFVRVNILDKSNAALMKQFAFSATPELYLVDRTGKVIGFWNDVVSPEELRAAFDTALK